MYVLSCVIFFCGKREYKKIGLTSTAKPGTRISAKVRQNRVLAFPQKTVARRYNFSLSSRLLQKKITQLYDLFVLAFTAKKVTHPYNENTIGGFCPRFADGL